MNKRHEDMIELKEQGLSYTQIGIVYGISRQRVHQIISKSKKKLTNHAKNPLQPPSEAQGGGLKRFFVGLLARIRKFGK